MIRATLTGVNWGTDPIQEQNPETGEVVEGMQINILDPHSGILFHIPFSGESLGTLVAELAAGLDEEQRREVMKKLSGGLILPGGNPGFPQPGPQG